MRMKGDDNSVKYMSLASSWRQWTRSCVTFTPRTIVPGSFADAGFADQSTPSEIIHALADRVAMEASEEKGVGPFSKYGSSRC